MTCPVCGSETKVINTRELGEDRVRRRRECMRCAYRFNTIEIEADALDAKTLQAAGAEMRKAVAFASELLETLQKTSSRFGRARGESPGKA